MKQVKIKLGKIQAHHSENDCGEGSSTEVMTDLDLKVEALFARDLLDLQIEPVPFIEPKLVGINISFFDKLKIFHIFSVTFLLIRFSHTIPDLRCESAKVVCSDSEPSEEIFIPKKRRGTPLKELFAESVNIQKECLKVVKDIRNQNSDIIGLLGLLLDQKTDRNYTRGSPDFLEEIKSSFKEHHSALNAIRNGVPSNCKTSRLKERAKTGSSSVGPACKIPKTTQVPDTHFLSSTLTLQQQQMEPPTPFQTQTNRQRQQKPQQPNLQPLQCTQPIQLQQKIPSKLKVPILLQFPPQKQQLILQPQQVQKLLFQLPCQQEIKPSQQPDHIKSNNPR